MTKTKAPPAPALMTHRELARRVGVSSTLLRRWVDRGVYPRPHSVVEQTWFYRVADVDHYLATGSWPAEPTRKSSMMPTPAPPPTDV